MFGSVWWVWCDVSGESGFGGHDMELLRFVLRERLELHFAVFVTSQPERRERCEKAAGRGMWGCGVEGGGRGWRHVCVLGSCEAGGEVGGVFEELKHGQLLVYG